MTPFLIRHLTTSAPVFFIREASSPTPISSGIFTVSGVFLAISSWRRRIRSCSSCLRLLPKLPPLRWLPRLWIFCLPLCILLARSGARVSRCSSYRARFTLPAFRVSTSFFSGTRVVGWFTGCLAGWGAFSLGASPLCSPLGGRSCLGASPLPPAGLPPSAGRFCPWFWGGCLRPLSRLPWLFLGALPSPLGAVAARAAWRSATWLFWVRYSKMMDSSLSSSTCMWFFGVVAYWVRIWVISLVCFPKSLATSWTRYFSKLK